MRGENTRELETFKSFETKVISSRLDKKVSVTTFYDEAILPRGSALAAPVHSAMIEGNSPLEIIFDFFAGRQQPGTAGVSAKITFEEIAFGNSSMSFAELLKFTNMMFAPHAFTRQEVQWVMTKSKTDRYAEVEGNWHGDQGGDQKQLNFVEFLSCVVRLSLICFGSLGKTPLEGVEETAKLLTLTDLPALKARLVRIARTNGGFGGWQEPTEHREEGARATISAKRPKALQDFMLPRPDMIDVQHALLGCIQKVKGACTWKAFSGPFISMVVPVTEPGSPHKFQLLLQGKSSTPIFPECDLSNLPFASSKYYPASLKGLASGMESSFDLYCDVPEPGEYTGHVSIFETRSKRVIGKVQVYLRAVPGSESDRMRALSSATSRTPSVASPVPGPVGDSGSRGLSASRVRPQSAQMAHKENNWGERDTWSPPQPGFVGLSSSAGRTSSVPMQGSPLSGTGRSVAILGRSASAMSLCSRTGKFKNPNTSLKDLIAPLPVKNPKAKFRMPAIHPSARKLKSASLMRQNELAPLAHRPDE